MGNTKKIIYSKNERILRSFCFVAIAVCVIIGILLFILSKPWLGAVVLLSCCISFFLVSSFFTQKIKKWFGHLPKKRVIYALFYILIILLCMGTTLIMTEMIANDYEHFQESALTFTEEQIKTAYPVSEMRSLEVINSFEFNDSYYFEIEVSYKIMGIGGADTVEYSFVYLRVNRYTGRITEIDFKQYVNTATFSN